MEISDYLAVPLVLTMTSVQKSDGEWVRRAAYPELAQCSVEGKSVMDTLERLDELRRDRTIELLSRQEPVPVPRRLRRTTHGAG